MTVTISNYDDDAPGTWISLREVAQRANVSIATASRAINRSGAVSRSAARRVRRVTAQVGYYPNACARALASGRSRVFGLMVSEIINPFFPVIVQTFEDLGFEHDYEVVVSSIAHNMLEAAARQMIERRVDGVAILAFGIETSLVEVFRSRNVPVFAVDIDSPGPLVKTVRIDYRHGMRQAVQHLAALGHVRIAFISGPPHLRTAMARKVAFQECMKEVGLGISRELLVKGDHTMEGGIEAMSELAALSDRPSAVVCSNDMTAIGVMRQAFQLAIDVPRDLSVVGFDDIHLAQFMTPPLTTVQISQAEIASLAFRALLGLVEVQSNGSSPEVYEIKTNLMLRRSTTLRARSGWGNR